MSITRIDDRTEIAIDELSYERAAPMGFLMLRNEIKYIRKDYICKYIIEKGKNDADLLFYS